MIIDEQIKKADAKIAELEAALIAAQEYRRELVNRDNLNKCTSPFGHNYQWGIVGCVHCGRVEDGGAA